MPAATPVCNGTITEDLSGLLHCDQPWSTIATPAFFDLTQIDPAIMGQSLAAGLTIGGLGLAFAWGGRLLYLTLMGKKP